MGKTKCVICRERFAKLYTPPRCHQCVSGRAKTMGRPPGIPQPAVMRKGTLRGELHVMRGPGRPRLDYDLSPEEIERRFEDARRRVTGRLSEVEIWATRYALEDA